MLMAPALFVLLGGGSDAEEEAFAEHPVEDEPVGDEGEGAEEGGLGGGAAEVEEAKAKMDAEAAFYKIFAEVGDEVGGDGVHADDDEGEGDAAILFDVDDPGEGGEEEEADAAGEEGPGRGPDALDDGADAGEVKEEAGGDEEAGGEEELAQGDFGLGGLEPAAGG